MLLMAVLVPLGRGTCRTMVEHSLCERGRDQAKGFRFGATGRGKKRKREVTEERRIKRSRGENERVPLKKEQEARFDVLL